MGDDLRDMFMSAAKAATQPLLIDDGDRAGELIASAVAEARQGRHAAVLLDEENLTAALPALREASLARAPITVLVWAGGDTRALGHEAIVPLLASGAGVLVAWSLDEVTELTAAATRAAFDSETPFAIVADIAHRDRHDGGTSNVPATPPGLLSGISQPPARDPLPELKARRTERAYTSRVPFALGSALRAVGEHAGRALGAMERFQTADADEIVVAIGAAFPAARTVAEERRRAGFRTGVLGLRALRPFHATDVVKALSRARGVVVIEPWDLPLCPSGAITAEIKAAFADAITWAPGFPGVGRVPPIVTVSLATLAEGAEERAVRAGLDELGTGERARRSLVMGSDVEG